MRWAVAIFAFLATVLVGAGARAGPAVDLYTLGSTADLFSRFGHSVACVVEDGASDGICYDYGVPDAKEQSDIVWGTYRGRAVFMVQRFPLSEVLAYYKDQERNIERQRLPLSQAEVRALADALEDDAARRLHYAYHPYRTNCTTLLRDRIDAASGGALRRGADDVRPGTPSFRRLSEAPLAGRLAELTVLALMLGPRAERPPTEWEGQFVPAGLRDAVQRRLGASPETIHDRKDPELPVTRHGGRVMLAAAGVALALFALRAARRGADAAARERRALGIVLGTLGLAAWLAAAGCALPELSATWALAVLVPSDVAIGWLGAARRARYLEVRLAVMAVALAAGAIDALHQPLAAPVALVALPLGVTLLGDRGLFRARSTSDTTSLNRAARPSA
jgi:hypothetical protein